MIALTRLALQISTVVLVIVALFTFIFGVHRVNDNEMYPNLNPGDLVFYYRLDQKYVVGDVLLYQYEGKSHLGRVTATERDQVDINEGGFMVNGSRQYEPKIYKDTLALQGGVNFPLTLGEKELFVMSDNRDQAKDSRMFGPLPEGKVAGKVFALMRRRSI